MLGGYISDLEAGDVFQPVEYVLTAFMATEYAHGVEEGWEGFHSSRAPGGRQMRPPTMIHVDKMRILEKNCLKELDHVVDVLKADSTLKLVIQGHTDSEGTDERNAALSVRRAMAVKKYLMAQGIAEDRLETHGYGSHRPIASNETAEGMAQNRRVEMVLRNWQKK